MDSKLLIVAETPFLSPLRDVVSRRQLPYFQPQLCPNYPSVSRTFRLSSNGNLRCFSAASAAVNSTFNGHSSPSKNGVYTVGDFMTTRENLAVVKPTTTVDEALEILVEKRITGFPVIDDDWKLVGLVSDYDLLALDTISGTGLGEASMFPEVDSSWKVFNELQKLLSKTNGKLVADVMTQAPLVVRQTTNLDDTARLLLETKYRRLPVVDADGKLVGIITRGNCIRAALQIKRASEKEAQ
ncbi:CBS domain-containing protein CBSX1, chloroplastic-like [Silene latifolia]|uniref:CBS domain-containing protein CBSX1, chloroplastic-like n=1 Tax=Silene latifolia TaxID=37657 RepID=UPI003D772A40